MNEPDDMTEPCPHCAKPVSAYAGCACSHCKQDVSKKPLIRGEGAKGRSMKTVSVFSNIGVGEAYLGQSGFRVELACELDEGRCKTYRRIYPGVDVIRGDITTPRVKQEYCEKAQGAYLLIATPPCQGFSTLNNRSKDDPRNYLARHVVELIEKVRPNYVLLENVPQMLTFELRNGQTPPEVMQSKLAAHYDIEWRVLDAKDYSTPQTRKRAVVLMTRNGEKKWQFPTPNPDVTSLRRAIWKLPSLESGERSGHHPLHYAQIHDPKQIEWMRQTPEGQSALLNMNDPDENDPYAHMPNVVEGGKRRGIRAFGNSYRRMKWDEPAPTLLQAAHKMSSSSTVHPGRSQDGSQSDARTLTILEAMRVMGLPDEWPLPHRLTYRQSIRCLGEGFCPKVVRALVGNIA